MGKIKIFKDMGDDSDAKRTTCCICIEIKLGQQILGCLMVVSAIMAVVQMVGAFGTYGMWGLVYAPMMLCSCFSAFKYIKWFQNVDEAETRGGLVTAWNVQILGWCISYIFVCVMIMVAPVQGAINTAADEATKAATAHMNAEQKKQYEKQMQEAKEAAAKLGQGLKMAIMIPIIITMLIGCCIQAYFRITSVEYAKDAGWKSE